MPWHDFASVSEPSLSPNAVCRCGRRSFFMQKKTVFKSVKGLALASMLTAMSVVIGMFCKTFMSFGGGLFRVTFENLPIIISGVTFGPIVGALVGAGSDLISYLLSPQIYPPNLVVTAGAATIGLVSGVIAWYVIPRRGLFQVIVSGGAAHILGSMIIKSIGLYSYYGILVLWRIPLYLVIAALELTVICWLFKRNSFRRLINEVSPQKPYKIRERNNENDLR